MGAFHLPIRRKYNSSIRSTELDIHQQSAHLKQTITIVAEAYSVEQNVQVMQFDMLSPSRLYLPVQQTAWSPPQLGATDEGWLSMADAAASVTMAAPRQRYLSMTCMVGLEVLR